MARGGHGFALRGGFGADQATVGERDRFFELLKETDQSPSILLAPVELGDQLLAIKVFGIKIFDARVCSSEVRGSHLSAPI